MLGVMSREEALLARCGQSFESEKRQRRQNRAADGRHPGRESILGSMVPTGCHARAPIRLLIEGPVAVDVRRFALVDRLAAAFRGVEGFAPYAFVVCAYSPSVLEGSWERPGITRSFRYDPEGPSSWIRVHGNPRIAWHRRVVGALERAGYTRTLRFKEETVCQRWLGTRRECLAELGFLAGVAEDGPALAPRKQTRPRSRAPRSPTLFEVLEAARAAPIPWNECALGFAHRDRLRGDLRGVSLLVGALGFEDQDGQRLDNFVSIFDPSSRDRAIPIGVQRRARRELRAAGYRLGKKAGSLFGTKEASTARNAVGECKRVLSRLTRSRGR